MGTQQWDRPEQRTPGPENHWHQVPRGRKLEVVMKTEQVATDTGSQGRAAGTKVIGGEMRERSGAWHGPGTWGPQLQLRELNVLMKNKREMGKNLARE